MTSCEDCGEDCGKGTDSPRRYRCPACDRLVCGWCWGHVHEPASDGLAAAECRDPKTGHSREEAP